MTYEGWTNWQTWNLNLHFDNDYRKYLKKVEFIKNHLSPSKLAYGILLKDVRRVRDFCYTQYRNGTPDMKPLDMNKVDYEELTAEWAGEYHDLVN